MAHLTFKMVFIALGFLWLNTAAMASSNPEEIELNKLDKKELISRLNAISMFHDESKNVFDTGIPLNEEIVLDAKGSPRFYIKTAEQTGRTDFAVKNKLTWDRLLRYGVLHYLKTKAATSNELAEFWNYNVTINMKLQNFAEDLNKYITEKDLVKEKVLENYVKYLRKIVNHLAISHANLEKVWFFRLLPGYSDREFGKQLLLKVNEKLEASIKKILRDYDEIQDLRFLEVELKHESSPLLTATVSVGLIPSEIEVVNAGTQGVSRKIQAWESWLKNPTNKGAKKLWDEETAAVKNALNAEEEARLARQKIMQEEKKRLLRLKDLEKAGRLSPQEEIELKELKGLKELMYLELLISRGTALNAKQAAQLPILREQLMNRRIKDREARLKTLQEKLDKNKRQPREWERKEISKLQSEITEIRAGK